MSFGIINLGKYIIFFHGGDGSFANVWDIFFHAKDVLEEKEWAEFMTISWCVWGVRNKYLFESEVNIDTRAWVKAIKFLHSY